jgi:iron complex outermembrane receptor protein
VFINSVSAEDQKKARDPGKIVITEEDIKKMKVHSMVDLLNQIPGVSATESSVRFRGSTTKQILVLLDGRTINDPTSSWRAVNWGAISINAIEKIEIYKGTGSVLYGDDTSGGVIGITTKKIAKGSQGNIEISYGRFDSQEYDLDYQQNLGNLGVALSAGWERTDGFRVNSDEDKKRMGIKLNHELDQKRSTSLSFDCSQLKKGSPGRSYSPTPHATAEEKNWGSTFLLSLDKLKSGTHYSEFKRMYEDPDTDMKNSMETWALNEELSSNISIGRFGKFNIGTGFEVAHVKGNKIVANGEEKYAVYATKDISFQKIPLRLGLGIRANFYSDFPCVINPQVQLEYGYKNINMQFSANRSNNIPTFYQRYYETNILEPNPDLGMEEAFNYSLSFSSGFKEWIEADISFFYNDMQDKITYVRENGSGRYRNIGSATRKGIETSLRWRPNDFWQVKTSYTFLIAKDEDTGKYLPYRPKHRLNLDIQLKPFESLSLSINARYASKRFANTENTNILRGRYFRSDFRADYSLNEKVTLFTKVDNLFDNDYDGTDGYPVTPRAWLMGMGYEF